MSDEQEGLQEATDEGSESERAQAGRLEQPKRLQPQAETKAEAKARADSLAALESRLANAEKALEALAATESEGVPEAILASANGLSSEGKIALFRGVKAELAKASAQPQREPPQLRKPQLEAQAPAAAQHAELTFEAELASMQANPQCTVGMLDKLARKYAFRRN